MPPSDVPSGMDGQKRSLPTPAQRLYKPAVEPAQTVLQLPPSNRGRVAIFIDASNLFYAASQLSINIDYKKLLIYLTDGSRLLRSFFYTGIDPNNEKQQGFLLWMRRNGYRVIAKELVQLPDGSKKANVEVEMAVDLLSLAPHYDTAVLVSGNGDLAYALDALSYRGVRIEVVGLRAMTSDRLIRIADVYLDPVDRKLPRKGVGSG